MNTVLAITTNPHTNQPAFAFVEDDSIVDIRTCYRPPSIRKWRVERTKSKRRWVAWRIHSKKKSGVVFDTWLGAFTYARLMVYVDYRMQGAK